MFDVLAHIVIFGSVQYLYASYIYVLCLPASPTLFFMRFSCVFLFAPFVCTPNYLFGGLLVVATSFILQDHRFPTDLATSCVKNWRN
jgi:hypothetical protein